MALCFTQQSAAATTSIGLEARSLTHTASSTKCRSTQAPNVGSVSQGNKFRVATAVQHMTENNGAVSEEAAGVVVYNSAF
jgi:hypothetical protein